MPQRKSGLPVHYCRHRNPYRDPTTREDLRARGSPVFRNRRGRTMNCRKAPSASWPRQMHGMPVRWRGWRKRSVSPLSPRAARTGRSDTRIWQAWRVRRCPIVAANGQEKVRHHQAPSDIQTLIQAHLDRLQADLRPVDPQRHTLIQSHPDGQRRTAQLQSGPGASPRRWLSRPPCVSGCPSSTP